MPTPFAEDHSYAAVVNMRPTHPQELASEQATQTPGVTLDVTPSQANIRNTPYDKGHEPVTPSEAQQHATLASRNAAVSGGGGGQSPKHPSRPDDSTVRFDTPLRGPAVEQILRPRAFLGAMEVHRGRF